MTMYKVLVPLPGETLLVPGTLPQFCISSEERVFWSATEEGANWLCTQLNSLGSASARLSCKTEGCPDKGSWIERAWEDIKRNVYHCETCKKAMQP